jgi:hypothetical protein
MPIDALTYIHGVTCLTVKATCTIISEALGILSHDRLTRFLNGDWAGQKLLEWAFQEFFRFHGGYLVMDDTVLRKSSNRRMQDVAWVYDSAEKKSVLGYSVVLLVWTDGRNHIPLAFRIWKPGQVSKFDLALELLSYARNRLRCKPEFILFDSWYSSKAMFKRIRDYGWYFVCRVKKNRNFNGKSLKKYKGHPYWEDVGMISGELKVLIVRYGKKYFATNRLSLTSKRVRQLYEFRHWIEEVFKVLKGELHLEDCQAWSRKAQEHHVALCLIAFCVLERERLDRGCTIYRAKRDASLQNRKLKIHSLERLRHAA